MTNSPHSTNLVPTLSEHEMSVANAIVRIFTPLTGEQRKRTVAMLRIHLGMVRSRRRRKPSIATLVKRAEKTGKTVTSITTADGTTLTFGEGEPSEANNPWLADIGKATIGAGEHSRRDIEAERLGRFEVYDQFELGRLLHGQVSRFLALQDAVNVSRGAVVLVDRIRPIGDQAATGDVQAITRVDRGQPVPRR
jgi:hypothetical protein